MITVFPSLCVCVCYQLNMNLYCEWREYEWDIFLYLKTERETKKQTKKYDLSLKFCSSIPTKVNHRISAEIAKEKKVESKWKSVEKWLESSGRWTLFTNGISTRETINWNRFCRTFAHRHSARTKGDRILGMYEKR